jgi:hypothetical protein
MMHKSYPGEAVDNIAAWVEARKQEKATSEAAASNASKYV